MTSTWTSTTTDLPELASTKMNGLIHNGNGYANGTGTGIGGVPSATSLSGKKTRIRLVRTRSSNRSKLNGRSISNSDLHSNMDYYTLNSWTNGRPNVDAVGTSSLLPGSSPSSSSPPNGHAHAHGSSSSSSPTTEIPRWQHVPSYQAQSQAQRSLYTRATTAFVKKEFLLAYEIVEDGTGLLSRFGPPRGGRSASGDSGENQDELGQGRDDVEWSTKWDILRLTIEALLYSEPTLVHPQTHAKGKGKGRIPSGLEELLVSHSPSSLLEKMYSRSLDLFGGAGLVPPSVALTLVMAGLKVASPESSRVIAEEWFAAHEHGAVEEPSSTGYRKMVRVYGERILPLLGEWDGAFEWVEGSAVLDGAEKEALMERLRGRRAEQERVRVQATEGHSPPTTEETGEQGKSVKGGSRPEGEGGGGKRVASPSRVCSPASVVSSSSSSSLLTHSTHTAVPTPVGWREEGEGRVRSASEGTATPRGGAITPRGVGEDVIERIRKQARVGALRGYLGRVGIIGLVMVLMGLYIGRRSELRGRGRMREWIKRQFVDFWDMALKGLAL